MFDSKIIRSVIRTAIILAFALSVAGFGGIETLFTPKAELWERWTAHQPGSNVKIDHSTWDWFLKSYVSVNDDGVNRVAYSDVDQAGHDRLDDYIRSMTEVTVDTLSRDEQLAYGSTFTTRSPSGSYSGIIQSKRSATLISHLTCSATDRGTIS